MIGPPWMNAGFQQAVTPIVITGGDNLCSIFLFSFNLLKKLIEKENSCGFTGVRPNAVNLSLYS
jgi:hypothetical protein